MTTLYNFTGTSDGGFPDTLVQGSDGKLYGTTGFDGSQLAGPVTGTIFRITLDGVLETLYSFTGAGDGSRPGYPDRRQRRQLLWPDRGGRRA